MSVTLSELELQLQQEQHTHTNTLTQKQKMRRINAIFEKKRKIYTIHLNVQRLLFVVLFVILNLCFNMIYTYAVYVKYIVTLSVTSEYRKYSLLHTFQSPITGLNPILQNLLIFDGKVGKYAY